jgi:glycosyltransferase involved in cell wall biosynthesis
MDREIAILPARNEEPRIERVLSGLRRALPSVTPVVIDDASSDATATAARRAGAVVVSHPIHLGYGAALATGYSFALENAVDRCLQLDADGQHDPSFGGSILAPLRSGTADVVLGSRFTARRPHARSVRGVGVLASRWLARSLAGVVATDPTTGFRALGALAMQFLLDWPLPDDYPDVDVLIAMHRSGLRLAEVAVPSIDRAGGASMHGGSRTLYYAYKVALSSVIATRRPPRERRAAHG